jgi:hypothetical protein
MIWLWNSKREECFMGILHEMEIPDGCGAYTNGIFI